MMLLVGGAMVASGLVMALLQATENPPDGTNTIVMAVVQILFTGGGIAVLGKFVLAQVDKYLETKRADDLAEREALHAERERELADDRAERSRKDQEHAELMKRYLAREDEYNSFWRQAWEAERARNDRLVESLAGKAPSVRPPGTS